MPSVAGSSTMPCRRSARSRALPLVVKLKIRLPEMAASVITKKTRAITPGGRSTCFRVRLAGAPASRGTSLPNRPPPTLAGAAAPGNHTPNHHAPRVGGGRGRGERRAPADELHEKAREERREGDAEIAG